MTVEKLEEFLKTVKDKKKFIYFYNADDKPFGEEIGIDNVFEVSRDAKNEGTFEGVYLKGC